MDNKFTDNEIQTASLMHDCTLCPRECGSDRLSGETGYCGQTAEIKAARAALHMWEEPCISGSNGSGAVFFSGCNMRCIFCQNADIASSSVGRAITAEHLSEIFLQLQDKHANNINLVTPSHFVPQIREALILSKNNGLHIPVIYNTSAYEKTETLQMLDGLIDVYLPDLKYYSSELSARYSGAPDYFTRASAAISEMFRQTGAPQFMPEPRFGSAPIPGSVYDLSHEGCDASDGYDISESEVIKRGVIVRHLCMPGSVSDSKAVLVYLYNTYHDRIYISIMSQYTPMPSMAADPLLCRTLSAGEYEEVVDYCISLGMENAFIQDGTTASESFIPSFDYEGL